MLPNSSYNPAAGRPPPSFMARHASPHSSISGNTESSTSTSSGNSEIDWPFGARLGTLRRSELRETAYEIFFMSCRSSTGFRNRGATAYVGSRGDVVEFPSSLQQPAIVGPKGGTGMMVVTSKVKNVLGLKARRAPPMLTMNAVALRSVANLYAAIPNSPGRNAVPSSPGRIKRPMTSAEIMRRQMRVTDQSDSRLRKILMRSFVGQNGRRAETIILPLELLRHLKPSEFNDSQEYHQWQRRQLKILEVGLLLHPSLPLDRLNAAALLFRQVLLDSEVKPIDTSKNSEDMRNLSSAVTALAWRSSTASNNGNCHWADGFPVNVHLYLALLKSIFDLREETVVLDEVDEILELLKKTWPTLGINRVIHNVCFTWVLFHQYVVTAQIEPDLIKATLKMLFEVANDVKQGVDRDPNYIKVLSGVLVSMQGWTEKRLLDYHENFNKGTLENMEKILSLALSTTKIIVEDLPGMAGSTPGLVERETAAGPISSRVAFYIQRSLRNAFTKVFETGHGRVDSMIVEVDEDPSDILIQLAKDTEGIAAAEREKFSPVLRKWCPAAAGVALVTLHNCFGVILKQYLAKANSLTNNLVRVLHCASSLEKLLMQMVADDAGANEDGNKNYSLLREMVPYEVDTIAVGLMKTWVDERLRIGRENVRRAKETENWMPKSKSEPFTQSAVDLIKLAKVTVDEFFQIPLVARDEMVHDLAEGLESIFQEYTNFVASCGNRQSYMPSLPPLTRCNQDSRLTKLWKKAKPCTTGMENQQVVVGGGGLVAGTPAGETHHPRSSTSRGTQRLYIRINTLHYLHSHIHSLDKSLTFFSRGGAGSVSALPGPSPTLRYHQQQLQANRRLTPATHFDLIRASIQVAIQRVSEVAAYRLIFLDTGHSFYGSLYVDDVSESRIRPTLRILKQNLNLLLTVLTDRAQPTAMKEVMRATFEAFLLVLLAGGTERAFVRTDYEMVMEDFRNLKRVFCASGEGLVSEEVVDKEARVVEGIIGLMGLPTEKIIEDFTNAAYASSGSSSPAEGRKLRMPPTTGRWSRSDPNTVLRVLCHRNDDAANNFLKKAFQLPKRR
ncbi:uncharacterized protein LOC110019025 isoform X2 [Phalaenopsis equestris]|uniref:uncharacterized protein LOC110019025 isoform X2 n=1 Tax=Phalaenopsis equestris TaxID=78828 RepID=UPI0009E41BE5|nr:uncharacterized protein LOC110019025 isoform X2 [Phalaenopsis equestris]